MQCCPEHIKAALKIIFSGFVWCNIAQGNHMCQMLAHDQQTTFMWKITIQCCINHAGTALHKNIVQSMLLNTSEATLLKKITYAVLTQSAQTCFFQKNNLCNVVLIYLSQHCTRNYLYNVGLQPITTLHRKIICNVDLSYVRERCAKKLPRVYPSNFDVRWMATKKNLPIEFSNSIFIKFCFKAYWH